MIASGLKRIDIGNDWFTSVRIGSVGISLQATDLGSSAAERWYYLARQPELVSSSSVLVAYLFVDKGI